jgi:hypothetical protein
VYVFLHLHALVAEGRQLEVDPHVLDSSVKGDDTIPTTARLQASGHTDPFARVLSLQLADIHDPATAGPHCLYRYLTVIITVRLCCSPGEEEEDDLMGLSFLEEALASLTARGKQAKKKS